MSGYYYERGLDEFKNLDHVLWVADHIGDYEFYGNTGQIRDELLERLPKLNTYYGEVCDVYARFVDLFDNNPFNYRTELIDGTQDFIACRFADHYFVTWQKNGKIYRVPAAWLIERGIGSAREVIDRQEGIFEEGRKVCLNAAQKISGQVQQYTDLYHKMILSMDDRLPAARHNAERDRMLLFLNWLVCLLSFRFNNIAMQLAGREIDGTAPQAASAAGLLAGFILVFLLLKKTALLFRGDYMVRRMGQMIAHDQNVERVRPAMEAAFYNLSMFNPIDYGEIARLGIKRDVLQLLDLTQMRFSARHFSGILLDQYGYETKKGQLLVPLLLGCVLLAAAVYM